MMLYQVDTREVSLDNHGNLYVSGSSSLMRVFSSSGQFLAGRSLIVHMACVFIKSMST